MKTELNEQEQLIATGLLTLFAYKKNDLDNIERSLAQLIEEEEDRFGSYAVIEDVLWGNFDTVNQKLASLLDWLRVKAEQDNE